MGELHDFDEDKNALGISDPRDCLGFRYADDVEGMEDREMIKIEAVNISDGDEVKFLDEDGRIIGFMKKDKYKEYVKYKGKFF